MCARRPTYVYRSPQITTGWYAADTWESIRSAISRQFHALLKEAPTSTPAPERDRVRWDASVDAESESSDDT